MFTSSRTVTPIALAVLLLGTGTLWYASSDTPPVSAGEPKDAKLKELLKERLATLTELAKAADQEYRIGKTSFDRVQQTSRALLDAQLELCATEKERITVLETIVTLAKQQEETAKQALQHWEGPEE